jgi:Ca2+-binding RTX toxin-like protein
VALLAPSLGRAAIHCRLNPESRVLSVSADESSEVTVRRVGPKIRVSKADSGALRCGSASPVVANTDRIKVVSEDFSAARIELGGGPFAPGATPEEDGAPEIELTLIGDGLVEVVGGAGPDHFRYLKAGGEKGVNLNADEDEDVDVAVDDSSPFFAVFDGGAGADVIDTRGDPGPSMFAVGGNGDDTLVAGPSGSILDGGRGRDRILGGHAFDFVAPGPGADSVEARGGGDVVEMKPDGSRDRVDCGSGTDEASRPDPFDRLRSCERVKRK